jgi:hypothetical protein
MAAETMNVEERFKYFRLMQQRYREAGRKGKARLLDEMQAMTGLHRKHLIARMNSPDLRRCKRNRQRSRIYGPDVEEAVQRVAEALDCPRLDRGRAAATWPGYHGAAPGALWPFDAERRFVVPIAAD